MNREATKKRRDAASIKAKRALQFARAEERVLAAAEQWHDAVNSYGASALAQKHNAEHELDVAVQTLKALR